MAWQSLVDGYAPKSSNDTATALQPILATPKRCKDATEFKERLTAWSLKVAEYEHQFKVVDEAVLKDIKREFLTGQRKFHGIMEKLEVIANEMMSDDGPTPMDLGNVGAYDAKTTHSDQDTSNVRRRVCDRLERVQRQQGSRKARTKRIRDVASRKSS